MLAGTLGDPLLREMLLCPVMFYGSASEHDLDWASFSVLFRSIFLEGLSRPRGGIRVVIKHLVRRFKELGGEIRLRAGVKQIVSDNDRAVGVILDDGTEISARQIISSAGVNETLRLCPCESGVAGVERSEPPASSSGKLTFIESICTLDCQPRELGYDETIVFYNSSEKFNYAQPTDLADLTSGIVCSPNNYCYTDGPGKVEPAEGTVRLTALANYDRWMALAPEEYQAQKHLWHERLLETAATVRARLSRPCCGSRHVHAEDRPAFHRPRSRGRLRLADQAPRRKYAAGELAPLRSRPRLCWHRWNDYQWHPCGEHGTAYGYKSEGRTQNAETSIALAASPCFMLPMSAAAAGFFFQADLVDRDSSLGAFAHIVNRQRRHAHGCECLHLDAGLRRYILPSPRSGSTIHREKQSRSSRHPAAADGRAELNRSCASRLGFQLVSPLRAHLLLTSFDRGSMPTSPPTSAPGRWPGQCAW